MENVDVFDEEQALFSLHYRIIRMYRFLMIKKEVVKTHTGVAHCKMIAPCGHELNVFWYLQKLGMFIACL